MGYPEPSGSWRSPRDMMKDTFVARKAIYRRTTRDMARNKIILPVALGILHAAPPRIARCGIKNFFAKAGETLQ